MKTKQQRQERIFLQKEQGPASILIVDFTPGHEDDDIDNFLVLG